MPIPESADAFVEVCVWVYQLSVYFDCLERKFGSDVAALVKSHLLTLMGDKFANAQLYFDAVQRGRALPEREPLLEKDPAIQIDANVAKALLGTAAESEETKAAIFPILGNSLSLGRISAEARFRHIVDLMNFRPETVVGLRKPDKIPIQWSDSPGCFEEHLKRRHMNPLFPAARRMITGSDVTEARARDLADLKELHAQYEAIVRGVNGLPDQDAFSECLKLRERLENLLVRAAEIGSMARDQKVSLQRLYDVLVGAMRQAIPPEHKSKLDEALALSARFQEAAAHDLFAQICRSDTPILPVDVVPTLLSEGVGAVRLFVAKTKEGRQQKATSGLYEQAVILISNAQKEGHTVPEADEKLSALQSLVSG